jgi:hypothetical protein
MIPRGPSDIRPGTRPVDPREAHVQVGSGRTDMSRGVAARAPVVAVAVPVATGGLVITPGESRSAVKVVRLAPPSDAERRAALEREERARAAAARTTTGLGGRVVPGRG